MEAIIALPDQLFYNTGISTYIWIFNNHKSEQRKVKIQLINATGAKDDELIKAGERNFNRFWEKMPRSLGNKRKQIPKNGNDKGIGFITRLYGDFEENEFVKILPKAWIDESKTKTGYEINFTKYFYEFKPLRSLAEIKADILALEASSLELEKTVLED